MATLYTAIQSQRRKNKTEKNPTRLYGIRHSVEGFALQLHSVTGVCFVI